MRCCNYCYLPTGGDDNAHAFSRFLLGLPDHQTIFHLNTP